MPRHKQTRRHRCDVQVEPLEVRSLLSGVTLSGNIFQQLNVSGLFPNPSTPAQPGTFLSPVTGVSVQLDKETPVVSPTGSYTFTGVGPGVHTVSISQLPAGYVGFSGQSLAYTLTIPQNASNYQTPTLNFELTPKNQALIQNLYELVLSRAADLDGFDQQLSVVNNGGTVGQVFNNLYTSGEFQNESQPIAYLVEAFFPGGLNVAAFRESVQLQNLGTAQDATVLQFLYSKPFLTKYGDTSQLSNSGYVTFLYEHLLGRAPTESELGAWVALLRPRAGGGPELANRGDVALSLVDSQQFAAARPGVIAKAGISLAYLGVLGRNVKPKELSAWVVKVDAGTTIEQVAQQLSQEPEYQNLTGFTNTFYWDVQTDQVPPAVNPLSRLKKYDPKTGKFDESVTARSIKSTAAQPVDAYFLVHGWAPGLTQSVLLNSTPGDPEKWWNTDDSPWLLNGVKPVSDAGLARSIVTADKNAEVFAYSWIDQSATPTGSIATVTAKLTAHSDVVARVNTTNLAVGMNVTGPGIPANAYIVAIGDNNTITLSQNASSTIAASLTVETSQFTLPAQLRSNSAVVSGIDTSHLVAGMAASGPATAIPANTTIVSVDGPNQITLSANSTAGGAAELRFIGENMAYQTLTATTSAKSFTITGVDTSNLTSGMTVSGTGIPSNDTIFSIDGASQVTLNVAATSSGTNPLTFKGTNLAALLSQNLYASQSESYTQSNGVVMANAIHKALAKNFFTYGTSTGAGLIHIMGHSHGSKVATVAALTLQQQNVPVAQLTLLESPEDGPQYGGISTSLAGLGGAQNFNWYYLDQMNISKTPLIGSRGSTNATFVDNYYAYQGVGSALGGFDLSNFGPIPNAKNELSNIVDVELDPEILYGPLSISGNSGAISTILQSHGYPPPWYGQTGLEPATGQPIGINWSPLLNSAAAPAQNSYEQVIYSPTADLTAGSAVVTNVSQLTNLAVGMPVSDYYNPAFIPAQTIIAAIDPDDDILTLSQPALKSGTGETLSVLNQYALQSSIRPVFTPTLQTTLGYAQEYTTGTVNDSGSSITLTVNPKSSSAIEAVTFNPLATQGTSYSGAGMNFQVSFSDVPAGQQVQLVVWINDPATAPQIINPYNPFAYIQTGSTMGYMSIPLFTASSTVAGTTTENATISLSGYLNSSLLLAPFNAVNSANTSTLQPTLGFTLVGNVTSTASVTVSDMNQFAVGD